MAVAVCPPVAGSKSRRRNLSHRDEYSELTFGAPVDFSFKRLTSLDELHANESPKAQRTRRAPVQLQNKRFVSASLWLNHNQLTDVRGLASLMRGLIAQPDALGWLDLSFNNLTDIADDVLQFPQLRILYLHGNQLTKLNSVAKLRHLQKLRNLTLRGNPIDEIPSYRSYIISIIPQITRLDFVPISAGERGSAPPAGFAKKKAMLLK
ncbi:Leucine-rich repeat-containing protein 51 [Frankliniella fusca]|uniref:Leucine-rich repeat-containing protein 51 n=1 Tax=Frankliniella fusca TaxID=407009 RepID=A0AAE1GVW1_9NEOP|nr:Leucine-rich repeat-containing protein 51 [Frankliniella fusca]